MKPALTVQLNTELIRNKLLKFFVHFFGSVQNGKVQIAFEIFFSEFLIQISGQKNVKLGSWMRFHSLERLVQSLYILLLCHFHTDLNYFQKV